MATINQVKAGLEIWEKLGYGKCIVLVDYDTILAGASEGEVSPDEKAELIEAGWTTGEFGWEIRCD